ncbi:Serine/threonine protein kinase [Thermomonospora echinospora]|uniref:Serine/threonine protein kinase n=1 Tax=Thermomonospora echinospora TaxID=1992 RepID=A0A1H6B3C2_9ACTN|nr:serine/threonine-protein kinase [Thermomonospora echinospora]SEG55054.1 Serine/threonine protein kinase [Thermomonospora echinospora]
MVAEIPNADRSGRAAGGQDRSQPSGLPPKASPSRAGDPRRLGAYEVLGFLGEGGMGSVHLGRGPDGELVAIKVVRSPYARDARFRARFRREADSALRVPRFCTAEVLAADPDADPPFLVTEFIDGPTLEEAVQTGGPLRRGELEQLGVSMAAALTSIHGAGVVHRDLKPSNVLLSRLGPRVIDFGIASALDVTSALTTTGAIIGTPTFMAPEQFEGHEAVPATDVFAWGGVMIFAATGRRPFGAGPVQAVGYRVVHGEPDLDGLDGRMREIVAAALHKDPARRPTARQLLEIMGVSDGDPATAVRERLSTRQASPADDPRRYDAPGPYGPATGTRPPMAAPPAGPGQGFPGVPTRPVTARRSRTGWVVGAAAGAFALVIALALTLVLITRGNGEDLEGYWRGTYGDQYVSVEGSKVRMYYPSRNGRIAATLNGDTIQGWWVEGDDTSGGGRVTFRIVRDGDSLKMDGAWSSGRAEPSDEWDLTRVNGDILASAQAVLNNDALFPTPTGG